ncbi:hypothetical protein PAXINDRAFT_154119 [Paxillus involutus ATCC 200175]|nr:hypothetical protein PAXINDRAFT_154119 [Paxillus involutus ATCC 200175]
MPQSIFKSLVIPYITMMFALALPLIPTFYLCTSPIWEHPATIVGILSSALIAIYFLYESANKVAESWSAAGLHTADSNNSSEQQQLSVRSHPSTAAGTATPIGPQPEYCELSHLYTSLNLLPDDSYQPLISKSNLRSSSMYSLV